MQCQMRAVWFHARNAIKRVRSFAYGGYPTFMPAEPRLLQLCFCRVANVVTFPRVRATDLTQGALA